ncbi:MAG: carbon storage regulator [Sedimenticola sp.]
MLILRRSPRPGDQTIFIKKNRDEVIKVSILSVDVDQVRVGISAPMEYSISREKRHAPVKNRKVT